MNQQNDSKADSERVYQGSHEVMKNAHCACVRYEYTLCHEIARIFGISKLFVLQNMIEKAKISDKFIFKSYLELLSRYGIRDGGSLTGRARLPESSHIHSSSSLERLTLAMRNLCW